MVKVVSAYSYPGLITTKLPPMNLDLLFVRESVLSATGVTEEEFVSQKHRVPHSVMRARSIFSWYVGCYTAYTQKEIGGIIRPKRPLDHSSIAYYKQQFRDLLKIKDEGLAIALNKFIQAITTSTNSFTTNPTQ